MYSRPNLRYGSVMRQSGRSRAGMHWPQCALIIALWVSFAEPSTAVAAGDASGCPVRALPEVVSVAHNAGNSFESIQAALDAGADVVELDLREHQDTLVSSHYPVVSLGGRTLFGGINAKQAIEASREANGVLLDLKQADPHFLGQVSTLIDLIPAGQRIYVSSPDLFSLVFLKSERPQIFPLLTVTSELVLGVMMATEPSPSLAGVSVRHDLLTGSVSDWMCSRQMATFAWPVGDAQIALNLIAQGVTGITTGDPSILRALSDN